MDQRLIILVAEDDENDALLLQRAFRKAGIPYPVHVCRDGEEVLEYLQGRGPFADRQKYPFPRVLLTDLKMPRRDGLEVLEWLYQHPECNVVPTIVLSASNQPQDVKRVFQLGANCYFRKPSTLDELVSLVKLLWEFWTRSEIPPLPTSCGETNH